MIVDHETLVFFDASCLVAAARSPQGGSGYVLSLCERGYLRAAISQGVQFETERNLAGALGEQEISAFKDALKRSRATVVAILPVDERDDEYFDIAGEKDEHVLAAAVVSRSRFLLTLDKALTRRVNASTLELRALSPGEFLNEILPLHYRYDDIRG